MSNYKCINCGDVRQVEEKCSCSRCGYTMYQMPFDKKTVLLKECKRFFKTILAPCIEIHHFEFYRVEIDSETDKEQIIYKSEDDARFPSFDTIKKYILSARTSELMIERAKTSLAQIKAYISTPYAQTYRVFDSRAYEEIKRRDEIIIKAMDVMDVKMPLCDIRIPSFVLHYSDNPDEDLLSLSYSLIDSLSKLADKMLKYIKQNNAYGATEISEDCGLEIPKDSVPSKYDVLFGQNLKVNAILSKKYIVDILSDGYEELQEMTETFIVALQALLEFSALEHSYCYQFEDGDIIFGDGFIANINAHLSERYIECQSFIICNLNEKRYSENELFDIYDQFIELDDFGIFRANKTERFKMGVYRRQLDALIGLESVKETVNKISAYAEMNKDSANLNLHMCFYGNPGTGKTEVARIIAGLLYEIGVLPTNEVVEVDRSNLVGSYVGETALKTSKVIQSAMGGVLFIDEAYSLTYSDSKGDYGSEAVSTLIKAMEDHRGEFCVILAGYKNQMADMIASNPGFRSRIQFEVDFPNYSRNELGDIADYMIKSRGYELTSEAKDLLLDITDLKRKEPNFANAREVRNILDQLIMCQNLRSLSRDDKEIGLVDAKRYISDMGIPVNPSKDEFKPKILSAEEELEALIGLDSVKRMVKKIRAYAKRNAQNNDLNLHMCFYGNPGTGKTEVARIVSRLLYDAGILSEAKLVETDAHGLIGRYVGETAPKTEAKIADAMGGVLFIDEAYALYNSQNNGLSNIGYGDEAVSVLLKKMEDCRGKFCVVFAGYREQMQKMISSNPGLESRVQFTLDFPDYTREELMQIALRFADKKGYVFEIDALTLFSDVIEYYRDKPNFANARTVRNVLDQVIMNQNLRTEDEDNSDNIIILQDVEDYIADENIM